jgi:hypothetical protein
MDTALWTNVFFGATAGGIGLVAWRLRAEAVRARREHAIRGHVFEGRLFDKLMAMHPQLTLKDCHLVARALRQFFLAYLKAGRAGVGMPSRVVDDLWHEFILDTRAYARFCEQAFGAYFHHVPASGLARGSSANQGLRNTWRWVCLEENINPKKPTRMPLLFALDDKLKIEGGQHFTLPGQPGRAGAAPVSFADRRGNSHGSSSSSSSSSCSGDGGSSLACSGGGLFGDGGSESSSSSSGDSGGSSCSGGCGGGGSSD